MCVLKFPQVITAFPPVAVTNSCAATFSLESCVLTQPFVESTKNKTTDWHLLFLLVNSY
jgi:hypothetical protein